MLILAKYKIHGHSMLPHFKDGQVILASNLPFVFRKPKIGEVIAFKKNEKVLIKRIVKSLNEKYFVEGDNKKDSIDSRSFGYIKNKDIIGKVIFTL